MPATQSSSISASSTIWCNYKLPAPAREILEKGINSGPTGRKIFFAFEHPEAESGHFGDAEIAFGQPDPAAVIAAPQIKWVHLTSAGYDRFDRDDLLQAMRSRRGIITNSSSVYDDPCAQHVLAFMLAHARRLPDCFANQAGKREWNSRTIRPASYLLTGQNVLILGYGAIARRLIEFLHPFAMEISAIRRTPRGDESVPTFTRDKLVELFPKADHIVNVLPGGEINRDFFSREHFAAIKPGSVFYNVGRGITVDQPALIEALASGRLAAAYLDVTRPEPLPPEDPLWAAPNCHITPHSAGGHANEHERLVRHFLANLARYDNSAELSDRVM